MLVNIYKLKMSSFCYDEAQPASSSQGRQARDNDTEENYNYKDCGQELMHLDSDDLKA
jgi:hypothetical protein